MIFWLDDALFFEKTVHDLDRLTLFRLAFRQQHTLFISDNPDRPWQEETATHFKKWCAALPANLQQEVMLLALGLRELDSNAITRGKAKPFWISQRTLPNDTGACILTIEQALLAIALPFGILLENQINDAAFLRHAMPPRWRNKLGEWEAQGRLRYLQGGGITELFSLVKFHCADANSRLTSGLPAVVWAYLHFVIYDHDGDSAAQASAHSQKLQNLLEEMGMKARSHQLWRRTQENYLPRAALEQHVAAKCTNAETITATMAEIESLFQGDAGVRHFFNMNELPCGKIFKKVFFDHDAQYWDQVADRGASAEMTVLAENIAAAM